VRQITGDAGLPGHCGMGFWTNADGRYPSLPRDTYYGAGAGDQLLIVVPSLNLIVVRNGEALAPEPKNAKDVFEGFHDQRVKILFEPVLAAITDRPKGAKTTMRLGLVLASSLFVRPGAGGGQPPGAGAGRRSQG